MHQIGIDTGKDTLHRCIAQEGIPPQKWKVIAISLKESDWQITLTAAMDDNTTIAAETTGWHYFMLIVQACKVKFINPSIYHVAHQHKRGM